MISYDTWYLSRKGEFWGVMTSMVWQRGGQRDWLWFLSLFLKPLKKGRSCLAMTAMKLECCYREGKSTSITQLKSMWFPFFLAHISYNQFWLMGYEWELFSLFFLKAGMYTKCWWARLDHVDEENILPCCPSNRIEGFGPLDNLMEERAIYLPRRAHLLLTERNIFPSAIK